MGQHWSSLWNCWNWVKSLSSQFLPTKSFGRMRAFSSWPCWGDMSSTVGQRTRNHQQRTKTAAHLLVAQTEKARRKINRWFFDTKSILKDCARYQFYTNQYYNFRMNWLFWIIWLWTMCTSRRNGCRCIIMYMYRPVSQPAHVCVPKQRYNVTEVDSKLEWNDVEVD